MRLYNFWRSSASHRVRIVLHWKEIEFEYVAVRLAAAEGEQLAPTFREKNPMAQVPCLEWEEGGTLRRLGQSVAIVEYLEERFPGRPLLPSSCWERAQVRAVVETINSGIQPLQNLQPKAAVEALGGDGLAWCRRWNEAGLAALELLARPVAGRYMLGDEVTLADAFLAPQLAAARRFGVDVNLFPTLVAADARTAELSAFQLALPERQPDARPAA